MQAATTLARRARIAGLRAKMVTRNELIEWLQTFLETEHFAVDDGGLAIAAVSQPESYIEIGGLPE